MTSRGASQSYGGGEQGILLVLGALVLSLGAHLVAYVILTALPYLRFLDPDPISVELYEAPPPPPPPPPPPLPEPPPPPPPDPEPPRPRPRREPPPEPDPEPPPPAPEPEPPPASPDPTPRDFTMGNIQSNSLQAEGGMAVSVGTRPGNPGGGRRGGRGGEPGGTGTAPSAGPPMIPLADLSRRPRPPDLNQALERHYPRDARRQGIEGRAELTAVIMPDGRVGRIRVRRETHAGVGFGEACRRTIADSRWSPPLDRRGQPVSTVIQYTCTFEIRY